MTTPPGSGAVHPRTAERGGALRTLAHAALAHYALGDPGDFRLVRLAESFNTVFRVDTGDRRHVLRIGPADRVHAPGGVALEQRWTTDLAARGLTVPRVVPTRDGAPCVRIPDPVDDGRRASRECTLLTWVPGRPLQRPVTAGDVAGLAALGARLHAASPPLTTAPVGTPDARSVLYFALPDRLAELDDRSRGVLVAARERAQHALDELWRTAAEPPRLVHGDLTPSNVVRDGTHLLPLDFQDLAWAHVEQDLAHSIHGVTRGVDHVQGLETFRAAYEHVRPWPALDLQLLHDLVAARRVSIVNLAVHRGRPDLGAYVAAHVQALRPYVA